MIDKLRIEFLFRHILKKVKTVWQICFFKHSTCFSKGEKGIRSNCKFEMIRKMSLNVWICTHRQEPIYIQKHENQPEKGESESSNFFVCVNIHNDTVTNSTYTGRKLQKTLHGGKSK